MKKTTVIKMAQVGKSLSEFVKASVNGKKLDHMNLDMEPYSDTQIAGKPPTTVDEIVPATEFSDWNQHATQSTSSLGVSQESESDIPEYDEDAEGIQQIPDGSLASTKLFSCDLKSFASLSPELIPGAIYELLQSFKSAIERADCPTFLLKDSKNSTAELLMQRLSSPLTMGSREERNSLSPIDQGPTIQGVKQVVIHQAQDPVPQDIEPLPSDKGEVFGVEELDSALALLVEGIRLPQRRNKSRRTVLTLDTDGLSESTIRMMSSRKPELKAREIIIACLKRKKVWDYLQTKCIVDELLKS